MTESLQTQLGLEPTAIVLAKVKGYPAWPAMVLQDDLLPDNIQQLKPKSVKQTKKGPPIVAVPVRFFADNTYIWIKSVDLKPLDKDAIAAFLHKRSRKTDPLVQAYTLAQDPPDMAEFIRWGSQGPPSELPESADDDDEPPQPPKKKLKLKFSTKKNDKSGTKSKTSTKSRSKATPKPKAAPKPQATEDDGDGFADYAEFEKELDQEDSSSDSDWGLDDEPYDYDEGDYVFEDKDEQKRFVYDFPSAAGLAKTLQYYTKHLASIHRQISPGLLAADFSEKQVVNEVREVAKLLSRNELPPVVLTRSRLFRTLLLVLHKPKEKFPLRAVRGAIQDLMGKLKLTPCEVTLEDLVVKQSPEPDTTAADESPADGTADDAVEVSAAEAAVTETDTAVGETGEPVEEPAASHQPADDANDGPDATGGPESDISTNEIKRESEETKVPASEPPTSSHEL